MSLNVLSFPKLQEEDSLSANINLMELGRTNQDLSLLEDIRDETDFAGIVGQSSALRQVLQLIEMLAVSNATVLLLGETGTGKELFARAIHTRSQRGQRTFVTLNCAAIKDEQRASGRA